MEKVPVGHVDKGVTFVETALLKKMSQEHLPASGFPLNTLGYASAVCVEGMIESHPSRMVVDTGAAVTIIQETVFREATVAVNRPLLKLDTHIVVANGKELEIIGKTELVLQIGHNQINFDVLVAKNILQECLLGYDFLENFDCVIDFPRKVLSICGEEIPLSCHKARSVCHVCCTESIIVPPRHEMIVEADVVQRPGTFIDGDTGMFQPEIKPFDQNGLLFAHSVSVVRKFKTFVHVLNPSFSSVNLYKDQTIGSLHPLGTTMSIGTAIPRNSVTSKAVRQEKLTEIITNLMSTVDNCLTDDEIQSFSHLLTKYSDVISVSDGDLGRSKLIQHGIETGSASPIKQPPRRLPYHLREEVKGLLAEMLFEDVIEKSNGPWSSPIVLIKKKDGSRRFCIDYRKLNCVTKKDAHPLPRIDDTLDVLQGAKLFSTLNLTSGYWQVEVDKNDREKTAFVTPFGLHQFKVMPFGLCNAPSTFQRLMELTLAGLQWESCLVYLDDIIIFSSTIDEQLHRLQLVLARLLLSGLKINQ